MLTRARAMEPSTFVVSLTPFDRDGNLDEAMLRAHFRRLAAAGIGVYVGGSGSGEGLTLTREETRRLYAIAGEELKGRVPVRAMGIEPRTAGEMIELARLAEEAGLDAMQVYSMVAPGAAPAEVEAYFSDVLSVVRMPSVISIHHAVGYVIPAGVVKRLVDRFDHVVGVNCTRADVELLDLVGAQVAVHVAEVTQILNHLALGGHGFLSQEANLVPRLCVSIIRHFRDGEAGRALAALATLLRVHEENRKHLGLRGIKAALDRLGLPGGHPRKPRLALSDLEQVTVAEVLERLGVLAIEELVAP